MKLLLITILFLSVSDMIGQGEQAQAILCSDSRFKCVIINRVDTGGNGLHEACCGDFMMVDDWDCTDDCAQVRGGTGEIPARGEGVQIIDNVLYIDGEKAGVVSLRSGQKAVNQEIPVLTTDLLGDLQYSGQQNSIIKNGHLIVDNERIASLESVWDGAIVSYTVWTRNGLRPTVDESLKLFPNPAEHSINMLLNSSVKGYTIHTLRGENVMQLDFGAVRNSQSHTIDVSELAKGAYLISIQTEAKVITKKFVKQ